MLLVSPISPSRCGRGGYGLWRATEEGALHVGISEAFELRSDAGQAGPLVVYAAGVMIVDERPAGSDTTPAEIDDSTGGAR